MNHIRLTEWRDGNAVHQCSRCRSELVVSFPTTALAWVAQVEQFKTLHLDCPAPWNRAKQVA